MPRIAARFCAGDRRFRLIEQRNGGLGAARNAGTSVASGELLAFMDSDDVVPTTPLGSVFTAHAPSD
jgi:CDP-glycerol glycerophosphotransferase